MHLVRCCSQTERAQVENFSFFWLWWRLFVSSPSHLVSAVTVFLFRAQRISSIQDSFHQLLSHLSPDISTCITTNATLQHRVSTLNFSCPIRCEHTEACAACQKNYSQLSRTHNATLTLTSILSSRLVIKNVYSDTNSYRVSSQ